MRVWVTRTEPGAGHLAALLAARGYSALNAPVLSIEPMSPPPPRGCFDFVLFVSAHAVRCAFGNGWRHGRCKVAAGIGVAAETALREHGVEPALVGLADAAAVVERWASPPSRTLIVKGMGGREVVQRWLHKSGKAVLEWDVYRRVPAAVPIRGERIDAIVAASGDGLRTIAARWFAERRPAVVPLLVPSERVARLAAAAGFENVVVTAGAADAAVLAALAKLREPRQAERQESVAPQDNRDTPEPRENSDG